MPIVEADLIHRYSGSGEVANPDLSLGGAINATDPNGVILTDTDNNDMDDITSTEAAAGIVIYRGFFYSNEVTTALTWIGPVFWIESQTSSAQTDIAIGIAVEAKNLAIEVIADEETAPSGVSFIAPANKASGIAIGDLDQDDFRGHWFRYNVSAGATSLVDSYTIRAEGDTLP